MDTMTRRRMLSDSFKKAKRYDLEHQMSNPQLAPLEVNPRTGEPFLRLRKHKNIIITPPRHEDVQKYIIYLNDQKVWEGLMSTPVPYLPEHAEEWFGKIKKSSDEALEALEAAREQPKPILLNVCPVRALREVKEDGTDVYIGDVGLGRVFDPRLLVLPKRDDATDEEREAALKLNNGLPLGDPNILWSFGDYLAPSHHGQGIMTDAIGTLLWDWGVPRMGVRRVRASAFEGNPGSVRTFEKNGFTVTQTLDKFMETRGKMRSLHVIEWAKDGLDN